ncbi:glycogen synthase GlgA [Alginatibacterium sediminis]|uniref:Glycogen synthase n=1 Tax=Alginatibacterium sediminis TaxID=2164068 RepID=A0A420ECN3_9ALTE|nr:glycogen synthase GlgA [Alginatibacterium sediminis]RKF18499.1 glycogen synthase GlgA [Alginatibacterium sediminis]
MNNSNFKILFVASEVESLAKTGGLADVAKALPLALKEQGFDVRIVMPFYKSINRREQAKSIASYQSHTIGFGISELKIADVPVYLVEHDDYFLRDELYTENGHGFADNGERFSFFSQAVFPLCETLDFKPDIIHCNDWHTGLVPFLLEKQYRGSEFFKDTRSVITIHNAAYQGIFPGQQFAKLESQLNIDELYEDHHAVNMLKTGIRFANKINAVSPSYAAELLTHLGSHGLSDILNERADDLSGILNGCDYSDWDPQTDPYLPSNYSQSDMSGKTVCRQSLQIKVGLEQNDVAIFGVVARLTEQKGFHMLIEALEDFLIHDVQVIIVGTGDPKLASQLHQLSQQYPQKLAFIEAYSNELAHLIEAGSDFFLMPSVFEPCGLNQMYSLAYATLPIVRAVGGLKDTVIDYDQNPEQATGFVFEQPSGQTLLNSLRRALLLYLEHPDAIQDMCDRAIQTRFLWQDSLPQYTELYKQA